MSPMTTGLSLTVTLSPTHLSLLLLFKVWSKDQQHQYHLETYQKCSTLALTLDLGNENMSFNKIPRSIECMLKFQKIYSLLLLKLPSESHVCSFLSPVKTYSLLSPAENYLWLGIFYTIKSSHSSFSVTQTYKALHNLMVSQYFPFIPATLIFYALVKQNCSCSRIQMLFHSSMSLHVLLSLHGMPFPARSIFQICTYL